MFLRKYLVRHWVEVLRVSSRLPFSTADVQQSHRAQDRDLCRIPIAAHIIASMSPTTQMDKNIKKFSTASLKNKIKKYICNYYVSIVRKISRFQQNHLAEATVYELQKKDCLPWSGCLTQLYLCCQ